jgi:hypothetical protein
MNSAAALLRECEAAGVEFRATAQGLRIRDSRRRLTAERRELIRQWEPALLECLRDSPATAEPTERRQEAAGAWGLLQVRGWVRITSRALGAEVLLLRDEQVPVPGQYADLVAFTLPELQGVDRAELLRLHAKRQVAAVPRLAPSSSLLTEAALRHTVADLFGGEPDPHPPTAENAPAW